MPATRARWSSTTSSRRRVPSSRRSTVRGASSATTSSCGSVSRRIRTTTTSIPPAARASGVGGSSPRYRSRLLTQRALDVRRILVLTRPLLFGSARILLRYVYFYPRLFARRRIGLVHHHHLRKQHDERDHHELDEDERDCAPVDV